MARGPHVLVVLPSQRSARPRRRACQVGTPARGRWAQQARNPRRASRRRSPVRARLGRDSSGDRLSLKSAAFDLAGDDRLLAESSYRACPHRSPGRRSHPVGQLRWGPLSPRAARLSRALAVATPARARGDWQPRGEDSTSSCMGCRRESLCNGPRRRQLESFRQTTGHCRSRCGHCRIQRTAVAPTAEAAQDVRRCHAAAPQRRRRPGISPQAVLWNCCSQAAAAR
mmetsp:Transcript_17436/g.47660  ORF Transcript_17436/g.47660 Transcript_17436/m.47660 type:complete len:227 (+) Transcript_17436:708-1388(+)